ncbi:MAG: HAD-IB family phosphatase [bacterium]
MSEKPVVAVFDFDGTISSSNSFWHFLLFLNRRNSQFNPVRPLLIVFSVLIGRTSKVEAQELLFSYFLKDLSDEQVKSIAADFAASEIPKILRKNAMERVAWHKFEKHRLIIVSAGLLDYLKPWALANNFEILASTLKSRENDTTSSLCFDIHCHGMKKVECLKGLLGDLNAYRLYVYGDSRGDYEMLKIADKRYYRYFNSGYEKIFEVVSLLRPKQWMKNAFVFIPLFFSHSWSSLIAIERTVIAAVAFSLVSSSVYVFNDWKDRVADSLHPTKWLRPLAREGISKSTAVILASALLIAGLLLSFSLSLTVGLIVASYIICNFGYSMGLKQVVILDVFLISAGFMARIFAGAAAISVITSPWLVLCGLLLTLFLGFAKRAAELRSLNERSNGQRQVLVDYDMDFLSEAMTICASGAIIGYGIYASSPETARLHGTVNLIYTLPLVAYGFLDTCI